MLATLGVAVALAAAAVLALLLLLWWGQERIVFQPSGAPYPEPREARRLDYRAEDGQPLFALVVGDDAAARPAIHPPAVGGYPPKAGAWPAAAGAREAGGWAPGGALLVFHGNADLAAWRVPWAREVARRTGRLVVLAEYRGYGGLPGPPTAAGVGRDARAALRAVREELGVPAGRVALYGHSLGSAVAAELAAEAPPEVLVLEAPFTSARAMARIVTTRAVELVWGLISRVPYDTERRVAALDAPVWVVHGERDLIIPARMGRSVYAAARQKGELLIVPRAGHNDVADAGGEEYWRWLERALRAER